MTYYEIITKPSNILFYRHISAPYKALTAVLKKSFFYINFTSDKINHAYQSTLIKSCSNRSNYN